MGAANYRMYRCAMGNTGPIRAKGNKSIHPFILLLSILCFTDHNTNLPPLKTDENTTYISFNFLLVWTIKIFHFKLEWTLPQSPNKVNWTTHTIIIYKSFRWIKLLKQILCRPLITSKSFFQHTLGLVLTSWILSFLLVIPVLIILIENIVGLDTDYCTLYTGTSSWWMLLLVIV